jgi:hypothetical protein
MSNPITHGGAYVVLPDGRTVTEAEAETLAAIKPKPAQAATKPQLKAADDGN